MRYQPVARNNAADAIRRKSGISLADTYLGYPHAALCLPPPFLGAAAAGYS